MPKALVRLSEQGDGHALASNLRLADRREVIAYTGESPRNGVERARYQSDECWTVTLEDEPIAMFGYCTDSDDSVNVWMLGSDKIQDIRWQFLRESKTWLKRLMKDYGRAWAVADVRNTVHKDWYEWLGFDIITTINAGPFNLPFYHIEYVKD